MSRPKKGTKSGDLASKRWKETMLKNHGGEEGLHKMMSRVGAIGGRNGHTGGFAANRELASIAGAKGGSISKRDEAKKWYDENKSKIDSMIEQGRTNKQIASALGVKLCKIYYINKRYGGKR